jgi:acetate kinase
VNFLIFNCGSSSLSYKVFRREGPGLVEETASGKAHRVGVTGTEPSFIEHRSQGKTSKEVAPMDTHARAALLALKYLSDAGMDIGCVGHRFVHGGSHFRGSVLLDDEALRKLQLCMPLAPIHNPISLSVIAECRRFFPDIPQYVTFDSAFHSSIPPHAYTYALPKRIAEKFGFRKYGFHGLSYSYISEQVSRLTESGGSEMRIVACHLGTGGSSVAAIRNGRSVDTSMGYSPLAGLVMSTRSGDIDPMLAIYLMALYGYSPDELMDALNKRSGLLGVSGFSSDIGDIIARIPGDKQAELAFNMYIHRLKKYVGSYVAALGGTDVLAFTDYIGAKNWLVRERTCEDMEWCGVELDRELNRAVRGDSVSVISRRRSRVCVVAIPTDEELVICLEGMGLFGETEHVSAV